MSVLFGFIDHAHNMSEKVTTIGVDTVYKMIAESAAKHTEEISAIYSNFITQGTKATMRIKLANNVKLQRITDTTQPLPVKLTGKYDQGFPLDKFATAWATDRKSRHTMTLQDANTMTLETLKADASHIKRHTLGALLTKSNYTFSDEEAGDVTVRPLANGDTVTYLKIGSSTPATANHYLAQANDIGDGADNPFPIIYSKLMEYDVNRGKDVIVYVADDLIDDVEALATYLEISDSAVIQGSASDRLDNARVPSAGPGERIIGRDSKCWIAEWSAIPSGYMVAVVVNPESPIVMQRNEAIPELQGFFPEFNGGDGNLAQMNMIRYCGFGVYNRVGAVAYMIGGGTYTDPTDAAAPLA